MYIIRRYAFIFFFVLLSVAVVPSLHAQERLIVKYKDNSLTPESIKQKAQAIEYKQNGNLFEKMQAQFMIWQDTQELGDNPLTLQAELKDAEKTARVKKQTEIFATKSKFRTADQQAELSPIRLVEISDAKYVDTALETYNNLDTVEWAVYDAPVTLFATPNDPLFSQQWPLQQSTDKDIDAPEAWNITTGSQNITTAIIDSGVDRNHPDLKDNIFVNTAEIPGNNIDDDNDGYIDDVYGWNFLQNNNDTFDVDSHGTHVAGIIAAKTNNSTGIAGVSQNKVLPLRIFTSGGVDEHTSDVLKAIQYAADNAQRFNIKALNMSFGATRARTDENASDVCVAYEPVLRNLYAKGVTAIAAAGNGESSKPLAPSEGVPYYTLAPVGCFGVISVGASTQDNLLASFSNYGSTMTLSAPGSSYPGILSTCPDNTYCNKIGTSMATPHVVGVAALMKAINPHLSPWQIKSILSNPANADPFAYPDPAKYGGAGVLNAYKAVVAAQNPPVATEPASMTVSDISASFVSYNVYNMNATVKIKVIDEATGLAAKEDNVVFTLKTPTGEVKNLSAFTDSNGIATTTVILSTMTLNGLQGNYTITIVTVAGGSNWYRPTLTSKTISSNGTNPTNTPAPSIVTPTPIRTVTPSPTIIINNTPTPTTITIPTPTVPQRTPTPTISVGTRTCSQACFYQYECAPTAPYCVKLSGSIFSYCSTSPTTITCTPIGSTNTPTPTIPFSSPTSPPPTPTPNVNSSICTQYLGANSSCRAPYECYLLKGSNTGISCGNSLFCCYGR